MPGVELGENSPYQANLFMAMLHGPFPLLIETALIDHCQQDDFFGTALSQNDVGMKDLPEFRIQNNPPPPQKQILRICSSQTRSL